MTVTLAIRTHVLKSMEADPLWSKPLNEAFQEYVETGKTQRLRELVEDYCNVKGLKVKEVKL